MLSYLYLQFQTELIRRMGYALGRPARLFPFPPILLKMAGIITGKSVAIDRLLRSLMVDCSKIRRELNGKHLFDGARIKRDGYVVSEKKKYLTQRRKDAKIKINLKKVMTENEIAKEIVDAAFQIHKRLGPGLLESVYEIVLAHELKKRGLKVKRQVPVAIVYDDIKFDEGFRADLIIKDKVIVELKSVENVVPVHKKQLLTYLRLADKRLGLLINFGAELIRDGISRVVNGL